MHFAHKYNLQLPQQHPRKTADKSPGTPIKTIQLINKYSPFISHLSSNPFLNFLIKDSVELAINMSIAQIKDNYLEQIYILFNLSNSSFCGQTT